MVPIKLCSLAALAVFGGSAAAQSFSFPVFYLTPYPSLSGASLTPTVGEDQFISPDGTIVFKAFLSNDQVVCRVTAGGPVVLARRNDAAPGSPGQTFGMFDQLRAGTAGASFRAGLAPSNTLGAYRADAQGIQPYLVAGQPAPGVPGFNTTYIGEITANHGRAAILGGLTANGNGEALWAGTPGAMGLLARRDTQAAGMPAGRVYAALIHAPALNAAGDVVFSAIVGPNPSTDGIWRGSPGNLTLIHQSGDPAPGIPGATLCSLWNPVVNDGGEIVFSAGVCNGITELDSLWRASNGSVEPLAIQGQAAPGTSAMFLALSPISGPPTHVLTNSGLVVFQATLSGPGVTSANNSGIWAGRPGDVHLIARTGNQAAGYAAGQTYQSLAVFGQGKAFGADASGRIVFPASISNGMGSALYMSDVEGHAVPIVRTGMSIPTGQGQSDTLSLFFVAMASGSSASGRPTILSDAGEVVFHARLTSLKYPLRQALGVVQLPPNCYGNCDLSSAAPLLTANDFVCFINKFAAGDPWANCDNSTGVPALTANDFLCFLNRFAAGCS